MTEEDPFLEELIDYMSQPIDTRMGNWLRYIGVKDNLIPSPLVGMVWSRMTEEEKNKFV